MSDVVDSLKRLERIGSEHSKTTEKLIAAAEQLSQEIVRLCALMPGQQIVVERSGYVMGLDGIQRIKPESERQRSIPQYTITHDALIFKGIRLTRFNRDLALKFSQHIANGLLDLIVSELENEDRVSTRVIGQLESAIRSLKIQQ